CVTSDILFKKSLKFKTKQYYSSRGKLLANAENLTNICAIWLPELNYNAHRFVREQEKTGYPFKKVACLYLKRR
ncbi:MAG: hypothetical protein KAG06_08035, partial [Methylococcales bacterium]|nr:hypothetical protein [Methylococcales bacterium]